MKSSFKSNLLFCKINSPESPINSPQLTTKLGSLNLQAFQSAGKPASIPGLPISITSRTIMYVQTCSSLSRMFRQEQVPSSTYSFDSKQVCMEGETPSSSPQLSVDKLLRNGIAEQSWGDLRSPLPPSHTPSARVSGKQVALFRTSGRRSVLMSVPMLSILLALLVPRRARRMSNMVPSVRVLRTWSFAPPAFGRLLRSFFGLESRSDLED